MCTEEAITDFKDHYTSMRDDPKWKDNAHVQASHAWVICLAMGCEGRGDLRPLKKASLLRKYVEVESKKLTIITDS